jgi:hypothetical protein
MASEVSRDDVPLVQFVDATGDIARNDIDAIYYCSV